MTMQLFTGMDYLRIDTANNFGLDKENWDTRIDWFHQVEGNLEAMIKDAEDPALFYASVLAYRQAQRGDPVSYPISLDATASGLQVLSMLTGCRKSALLCNMVDAGYRADAYTELHQRLCELAEEQGEPTGRIERKDTKRAIMTAFYSSTAVPKQVYGEGRMLDLFFQTMKTHAPGAWELNEAFLAMWNPNVLSNDWILPDGFHVHVKIMGQVKETIHFLNEPFEVFHKENMAMAEGRSLGANATHSVDGMVFREMNRRCNYNPKMIHDLKNDIFSRNQSMNRPRDQKVIELWKRFEDTGFLSHRIMQYIDRDNAGHVDAQVIMNRIKTLPKKPFEVLGIHDCFRCLPNYGNDLRKQYNQIMSEIAASNMLANLVQQITGRVIQVNKYEDLSADVLQANYALS